MQANPFRVMHTADLHLESGYSHGNVDKEGGLNSRFTDFADTWLQVCGRAVHEGVDLLVFAGDLARTREPSPTALRAFAAGLRLATDALIPALIVLGNHDTAASPGRASALDIFHDPSRGVYVSGRPELLTLRPKDPDDGRLLLCEATPSRIASDRGAPLIATLPAVPRSFAAAQDADGLSRDELDARIARGLMETARGLYAQAAVADRQELREGLTRGPRILVAHHTVSGAATSTEQATTFFGEPVLPLADLKEIGFDAIMLGHIHRRQALGTTGTPTVYCGSPERVDFGEAGEEKTVALWAFERHPAAPFGPVSVEYIPTQARPFITIRLQDDPVFDGAPTIPAPELAQDFTGAVVRLIYKGEADHAARIDRAGIVRQLAGYGAVKVVGPEVELVRPALIRDAALADAAGPLEALTRYLDGKLIEGPDREKLLAALGKLIEEQEGVV